MPVDDSGDLPSSREIKEPETETHPSEGDAVRPPTTEAAVERDANRPEPRTPQGRRRRFITRRNAALAALAVVMAVGALVFVVILSYRLGFIDRYIATQIRTTFANYGIRADIKEFHTAYSPRTVEMTGVELYDSASGEKLGKIDRILASVRIDDLYALSLKRNVNLESLQLDNPEVWVTFDEQGRSNFRNIHIPEPETNRRILFSYSTATIRLNNGVIHYGDERHDLSGEARNLQATVRPLDPNAPAESRANEVTLALSDSVFTFDGRAINNIDLQARARVDQKRAEIDELILRSPLAEARLTGTLDDWRAARYRMQIQSTIDLSQTSEILKTGAALRGAGNFEGTVTGEGTKYTVEGSVKSDALAADNIRLKALSITANGKGDGRTYEVQGKAVAELLTAGDFQLNAMQLVGQVMGTGTDFKWLGDLRAAAAKGPGVTIGGLIVNDAVAEHQGDAWSGSTSSVVINRLSAGGNTVNGARVNGVKVRFENNKINATANSAQAGTIATGNGRVEGVTANNINVVKNGEVTNVTVASTRIGAVDMAGAKTGSLNIAGVRVAIYDGGRVQGSTDDINVGTVELANVGGKSNLDGKVENVRVAKPVFVLEPQGRYRASADLSLGGGMLGAINLGAARAALVATNSQIQLNNFDAQVLNGKASGDAVISMTRSSSSSVNAEFAGLDIGNLVGALSGDVVPITGNATGNVALTFPGTNFSAASGTINTNFTAEAGDEDTGRTPVNGTVALRADRGIFNIERASLKTPSSELTATGQFSIAEEASNLQVNLNSSDAFELQRLIASTGLMEDTDAMLKALNVELRGELAFNGNIRGKLTDPLIDGRMSLGSLTIGGRDLGALSASLSVTPEQIRIDNGRLEERDGGGATFAIAVAPRSGESNTSLTATLDRANAGNLLAVIASLTSQDENSAIFSKLATMQSDLSGKIDVSGIPNTMSGSAELNFGKGTVAGEQFDSVIARANFSGNSVSLETLEANLNAGRIVAKGHYDTQTQAFNLDAQANNIQLDRLSGWFPNPARVPAMTGSVDLTASASGNLLEVSTYQINFRGEGREVTLNGRPVGLLTLVGRTENKQLNVEFTTGILGQPQVLTAHVDLSNEQLPATIETNLSGANLTDLFAALMPPEVNVRVTGRATGSVRVVGNLADEESGISLRGLKGTANFSELTVQVEDIPLTATSPLLVQFSSNEIFFEKTQFTGPGTNIAFGGTAAIGAGGRQNLSVDGTLNLRVLNTFSPNIFLTGQSQVAVRVYGSFEQPRINGTATVANASFATLIEDERWTLSNIKGSLRFDSNRAQIETLTGNLGGGKVVASGGAALDGFIPTRFSLNIRGDDVAVPYPEGFRSVADANLEINGSRTRQGFNSIVSGTVNLRRTEYTEDIELADMINRRREAALTEGPGDLEFGGAIQLDLHVEGRDALVVKNNLADIVGSVSLRVVGPVEDPIVSGRITSTRGTLNFRNDRYELARALIDLPASRGADPILNIQAESEIRGYRVIVSLTGPLSQPNATIRSDPSLPQQDVVSLITTGELSSGTSSSAASALAQTGLGTAASLLTDTLISAPAQRATDKLFGLNRFEIDPLLAGSSGGAGPTARLTVGRQVNRNLSVLYSTNITGYQNQVLALEYRVSDRLSFVASYEQGQSWQENFSRKNNNFSFEIRFRKRF